MKDAPMSFKVAVLELNQETNTFSKLKTTLKDFHLCHYFKGQEIETHCRGTNSEIGGFIECCEAYGWEPVYTIAARAEPGGLVEKSMIEHFQRDVAETLEGHKPDGVFIVFHGAMCTESADDAQIELLQFIRGIVGNDIPVAGTFDLHANSAPEMSALLDIAVSFRTYPHVDMAECGRKAGKLLEEAMRGQISPAIAVRQPPMLNGCNDGRTTHACAMTEILEIADQIAAQDGILATSINAGFYDADVLNTGPSAVICYDRNKVGEAQAVSHAEQLCQEIWNRREDEDNRLQAPEMPEAIRAHFASNTKQGPLVIADFSDNPGCGAYSDATTVLKGLLETNVGRAAFGAFCDPQAVAELAAAGIGAQCTVSLGGKVDPKIGGGAITLTGEVIAISDGNITFEGPMFQGLPASLGKSVCFRVGNTDMLISSERQQMLDKNLFRSVGIEPADYDIVVVKSQQHFRAAFGPIASAIIEVDADGLSTANLGARDYKKLRRPIYPLNAETTFSA